MSCIALYHMGCFVQGTEIDPSSPKMKDCLAPTPRASNVRRVYLIGDSIGASMHPGVVGATSYSTDAWEVHMLAIGCCAFYGDYLDILEARYLCNGLPTNCNALNQARRSLIFSDMKGGDLVMLSSYNHIIGKVVVSPAERQKYRDGLTTFSQSLSVAGVGLILATDHGNRLRTCDKAWNSNLQKHPKTDMVQANLWQNTLYSDLAQQSSNTYIWNTLDLLCSGGDCSCTVPGTHTGMYGDSHHFNGPGAFYFWPFLCDLIRSIDGKTTPSNNSNTAVRGNHKSNDLQSIEMPAYVLLSFTVFALVMSEVLRRHQMQNQESSTIRQNSLASPTTGSSIIDPQTSGVELGKETTPGSTGETQTSGVELGKETTPGSTGETQGETQTSGVELGKETTPGYAGVFPPETAK